jgi:hypothetical protein
MPRSPFLIEHARADVLVVGGGPAGIAAALAAATQGVSVLLVERYGFLGGMGAQGLESLCGFFATGTPPRKIVGGIPDCILERLQEWGAYCRPSSLGPAAGPVIQYNPDALKLVLDDLAQRASVRLLLHSFIVDALHEGDRVTGVVAAGKGGLVSLRAAVVVDASGDADVVAAAGLPYEGATLGGGQALTTTFRLANVDVERARALSRADIRALLQEARARGEEGLLAEESGLTFGVVPGTACANATRVRIEDPTDSSALTWAELEGRRQALAYLRFLREHVPGYEQAVLAGLGVQIGIRESRRIVGAYRLTREDVLSARCFPDGIARGGWPVEAHSGPKGIRIEGLAEGAAYDIPFRCLIPAGDPGMIVAGRCLSADPEAQASARVMGTCLAMGQAAGVAAALAVLGAISPAALPVEALRDRLRTLGAILE